MIDLKERRKALKEKIRHAYDSIEFITEEDKNLLDEIIGEVSSLVNAEKQAEIEALKAKLEHSEKVWISVDFMLPDEGEKVLIAIGDEQIVAEKCRVFGFIDSIDREALRTDLITHWMSLPEPPSKEANQGDAE